MWAEVCYSHKNGIDQPCMHPERDHCFGCDVHKWIIENNPWLKYTRLLGEIEIPMTVEVFFHDLPETEETILWRRKVAPYLAVLFKQVSQSKEEIK